MKYLFAICAMACMFSCTKKSSSPAQYTPDTTPGDITTFAGGGKNMYIGTTGPDTSVYLFTPTGVAVDAAGNVYIADVGNSLVRKVNTSGIVSTIAGTGTGGFSGDGGPATAAQLKSPYAVAVDAAGNVYVADLFNNNVRKITPSGIISTIAGLYFGGVGVGGFSGDGGPATAAALDNPYGVAVDASGNVYIADSRNQCVRKVNTAGIISTFAGIGYPGPAGHGYSGDGGPADSAKLDNPTGVAVDGSGNVYIADSYNQCIRKVNTSGIISTFAGNGYNASVFSPGGIMALQGEFTGDGGPASSAGLSLPFGVATDASGNVYIADTYNQRIRKVSAAGTITTIAGTGYNGGPGPGSGGLSGNRAPALAAELNGPAGIAVDATGNIYIADQFNYCVRKINK